MPFPFAFSGIDVCSVDSRVPSDACGFSSRVKAVMAAPRALDVDCHRTHIAVSFTTAKKRIYSTSTADTSRSPAQIRHPSEGVTSFGSTKDDGCECDHESSWRDLLVDEESGAVPEDEGDDEEDEGLGDGEEDV